MNDRAVGKAKSPAFSLLDDPLLRLQRFLRLAPADGFGASRRAVFYVLVTWLPVMAWAAATGRVGPANWRDVLVEHLGLHVRCLLAIPLLVLSAPFTDRVLRVIVANFPEAGLVHDEELDRFTAVVRSIERWRDSRIVWAIIVGIAVLVTVTTNRALTREDLDALGWSAAADRLDFGALWALYVVRPLFMLMQLAWLWRLVMTGMLFRGISRLDLRLIPSHPDRVGGLGFIELVPAAFGLVIFSLSSVACSSVARQILVHGAHLEDLKIQLGGLVVLLAVLFLSPLVPFSRSLRRVRLRGWLQYGGLAGRHVGGLHRRWIEGREVEDDAVLSAPEIGPAADVATLYGLAIGMRAIPIGLRSLIGVLLPALAPVLVVATLEVPLTDILFKVIGMLK